MLKNTFTFVNMYFIYTKNHPFVLFFTPLIIVAYLLTQTYFIEHTNWVDVNFGWFGDYTIAYTNALIINTIVLSLNSILINWIFNFNEFLDKNSYVPSLVYITLILFFDASLQLSGATLAQTFILLALFNVYGLNQQDDARKKAFSIGFFNGIAICLVPEYFPLAPLAFIQLWTFRPFRFKEFILVLFGMLTPFSYAFFISLFSTQISLTDVYIHIEKNLYRTVLQYLPIVIIGVSALFAWSGIQSRLQKGTVRIRRMVRALLFILLLGLFYITTDLLYTNEYYASVIIVIPITFGLSLAATHNKLSRFTLPFLYIVLLMTLFKFFNF